MRSIILLIVAVSLGCSNHNPEAEKVSESSRQKAIQEREQGAAARRQAISQAEADAEQKKIQELRETWVSRSNRNLESDFTIIESKALNNKSSEDAPYISVAQSYQTAEALLMQGFTADQVIKTGLLDDALKSSFPIDSVNEVGKYLKGHGKKPTLKNFQKVSLKLQVEHSVSYLEKSLDRTDAEIGKLDDAMQKAKDQAEKDVLEAKHDKLVAKLDRIQAELSAMDRQSQSLEEEMKELE